MRLAVVFNAHAGGGRSARLLPAISARLATLGMTAEFVLTRAPGHATDWVAQAELGGFDGLVAAGGDGTLFEVVNGLYRRPREERLPLGLLPIGTGNAFARDLGLGPGDWMSGLDLIAAGRRRRVDVGRVESGQDTFHFVNIIGMGFPVDAAQTARRLKLLGNGAYTMATLWRILGLRHYPLKMEIDGAVLEQDNVLVEVSNTRYTGTHFLIAPGARMDDGLLDVTLLRRLSRKRILRLFPTIYSGRHLEFEEVRTLQASHVRLLQPAGMPLAVDGELRGATPADITCLARDLEWLG